ncbi:MAG TPA: hypothetical protein VHD85_07105 [Terracidiphilus sp.]|jgi:hypothetical protein|nr:hypothetical protein [Terracidiphilus sp.]
MILRKATWSEAQASLRRAHKDKRARRHLFALAVMILAPALCFIYLLWLIGSGAFIFLPFVIPVIWLIRRSHRKQDESALRIAPGPASVRRELTSEERSAIRTHFATQALIYAVFVDRAASEAFLKQNTVPEGREIISRRLHLDLLKKIGAWDKMSQTDRDAMIDADGNWEWPRINQSSFAIEPLRLLRWILRVDFYLPLIGQQLRIDHTVANELVHDPDKVLKGDALASPAMLETGRDSARHYLLRCTAELISRGLEEAKTEEIKEWASRASATLSGNQNEDLLLDGTLVSEASEDQIRWARALAKTRADFLQSAIAVLEGSAPLTPQLSPAE